MGSNTLVCVSKYYKLKDALLSVITLQKAVDFIDKIKIYHVFIQNEIALRETKTQPFCKKYNYTCTDVK